MTEEQLITAAFEAIADTTVAPERVQARLAAHARAHRQRRLLLAGAGALGTAAAVGVPFLLQSRRPTPAPTPPATIPSSAPAPEPERLPLRYLPGWLPDGVVERFREVTSTYAGESRGSTRIWLPPGAFYDPDADTPDLKIAFSVDEKIDGDDGERVRIGDVTGRLMITDAAFLAWRPRGAPPMTLEVYGFPNVADLAVKIARRVTAGPGTVPVTMASTGVPERCRGYTSLRVRPTADGWFQELAFTSTDYGDDAHVFAQTGEVTGDSRYEPLYRAEQPGGWTVWVPRPGLSGAVIGGGKDLATEEYRRLLDTTTAVEPDLSWVTA
ncbi:hypothetical protein [Actinoplanes sp. NPDC051851]|uniref:hypothetical protein n=1 Tax=Actinoplanes sp. NPDC051851 TaxID=3154753 RepID=UPI0034262F32